MTKKIVRIVKAKPKTNDTPWSLLKEISAKWDMGPALNKRIEALVSDPMKVLPSFIEPRRVAEIDTGDYITINLGDVHGYACSVSHRKATGETMLQLGCQMKRTAERARNHWRGARGNSVQSGRDRPNVPALITWVERLCASRGWTW